MLLLHVQCYSFLMAVHGNFFWPTLFQQCLISGSNVYFCNVLWSISSIVRILSSPSKFIWRILSSEDSVLSLRYDMLLPVLSVLSFATFYFHFCRPRLSLDARCLPILDASDPKWTLQNNGYSIFYYSYLQNWIKQKTKTKQCMPWFEKTL